MKLLIALIAGTIFGLGLAVSGMTDSQKVLGFLDLFGQWDITLMFVMGGGLMITVPAFYWVQKNMQAPIANDGFDLPDTSRVIDNRLLIGSALFGIGWGLYGYCPGPALSSLSYGNVDSVYFVLAMLAGSFIAKKIPSH